MKKATRSVVNAAARARRELRAQARPAGAFDPSRYVSTSEQLRFLNVRTPIVRAPGLAIARERRADRSLADAMAFADLMIRNDHLELKGAGIETLACFRRQFAIPLLPAWKRWLADNLSANWAITRPPRNR